MAEGKEIPDMYESPCVQSPTVEEITSLSEELNLNCSPDDVIAIQGHFKGVAKGLQKLSKMKEPSLPVKYPRTPGNKPDKGDNPYNAWYWRCDIKGAATGKLAGKRIGIKDNVAVAGVPMMNGSRVIEGYTPEFDATVVTRILDAGGHILGKTNCEHFCFSGSSFTCDNGPVLNPCDMTRTTGGSSSGSGALVASGQVDMAIGGDQGGSIRIPASWCGIVGLKPTHGLVPYTGAMPIEVCVDHLGPMTRTVTDCALMLEAIAGYDEGRDPRQIPGLNVPEYSTLLEAGISGKRIGVLKEGFEECGEQDVVDVVRRAVNTLTEAGAVVEEVSIPMHKDALDIYLPVALAGSYECMIKGNGRGPLWKGFFPSSMLDALQRGMKSKPYYLSGIMKTVCILSEYVSRKYENKFYNKGQNMNMVLTRSYDQTLAKYDVIVMPTLPTKATKLPKPDATLEEQLKVGLSMINNTAPFDITGHPALSINAGFSEGLPVGMMIVGRHFDETTVLQVARVYEKIRDGE